MSRLDHSLRIPTSRSACSRLSVIALRGKHAEAMTISERVQADIVVAMKARDEDRLSTLQKVKSDWPQIVSDPQPRMGQRHLALWSYDISTLRLQLLLAPDRNVWV